jgi:Niemann-Pick C1 protein
MEGSKKSQNVIEKDPSATMNAALYCSFVDAMSHECFEKSILELWDFDSAVINQLTKENIINTINTYDKNAILGRFKNYEDLLGGIKRNGSGHITGAKSVQNFWMVMVNFTTVDMDKTGNNAGTADWASEEALEWETRFLYLLQNYKSDNNMTVYYTASRR